MEYAKHERKLAIAFSTHIFAGTSETGKNGVYWMTNRMVNAQIKIWQNKQCTCKLTMRRIVATMVAVVKQSVMPIVILYL